MREIGILTKRTMRLFLRERITVFFSFLSTIILVGLYFLFMARMYTQSLLTDGGGFFTKDSANFIVYLQMMSGVLILNSISLSTGVFSIISRDFESRKTDGFFLTPLKTWKLLLAYMSGGYGVSFLLNLFTWFLSLGLIRVMTGHIVTIETISVGVLILLFASFISCSIMLLLTAILKSSTAIGVLNGIFGSFFGFLCGIYIPYSELGSGTAAVGSVLPYTHLTIWMKQTVLNDAFAQLSVTGELKNMLMDEVFSAKNVGLFGQDVPLPVMLIISGVLAIICFLLAWVILGKRLGVKK